MTSSIRITVAVALAALTFAPAAQAQHASMPAGMTHEQHMEQMKKDADLKAHGQEAMGFDQDRATHAFTVTPEGGTIAVDANDPADEATRGLIRAHLLAVAIAFRQGDFSKPFMTHSEEAPGAPVLQRLKWDVYYYYAETPRGGIIRIRSVNPEAVDAVHAFLKFQIAEHHTGA